MVGAAPVLKVGVLNPFSGPVPDYSRLAMATKDGSLIATHQVNAMGGVNGATAQVVFGDLGGDPSSASSVLDAMMAAHPEVMALTSSILLQYVKPIFSAMRPYNLTMVGPVIGENDLHESFDSQYIHIAPSAAAEITAILKELLFVRNVRRIGVMTDVSVNFGNNFIPLVKKLLANLDLEVIDFFRGNHQTSTFNEEMERFVSKRPQAVLLLGPLTTLTGKFMATACSLLDKNFIVATTSPIVPIVVSTLSQLASSGGANGRLLVGMMTPSPDDPNLLISKEFRTWRAQTPGLTYTDSMLALAPHVSMYIMGAWLQTRMVFEVLKEMHEFTPAAFNKHVFSTRIYSMEDAIYGIYAGECVGVRKTLCRCNEGARQLYLANVAGNGQLIPLPEPSLEIPVSVCDSSGIAFLSPVYIGSVYPGTPLGNSTALSFAVGLNAFEAGASTSRESARVAYAYNPTAEGGYSAMKAVVEDRMVTAFTGCLFEEPLARTANMTQIAPIIDPSYSLPQLHMGYNRSILHILPTLEQQLHALSSFAASKDLGVKLFCTSAVGCGDIGISLRRSLDTFAVSFGGSTVGDASLESLAASSGAITVVLGLQSINSLSRIGDLLEANPSMFIALALSDLELSFKRILDAIPTDGSRQRLLHVTSLPHWDANGVAHSITAQYMSRVGVADRSPLSLRGFFTNHFVHAVAERVPGSFTAEIFLSNVYAVSVVVLDEDVVVGPFYDSSCAGAATRVTCETNVGARQVYVRSLGADPSLGESSFFQFESGRISYIPLPEPPETDIVLPLAIGLTVGIFVLIALVAAALFFIYSGKRNANAPKDTTAPFTVLFTDIQSSTSLWAEIPDIMGPALEDHHQMIRALIRKHNGYEVKTIGDAFMVAFKKASDAARLACELQHTFMAHDWPGDTSIDEMYLAFDGQKIQAADLDASGHSPDDLAALPIHLGEEEYRSRWKGLRVRVGINTSFGDIKKDEISGGYDYYGTVTNTAARTEAIAHGGQVVVTHDTYDAITRSEGSQEFVFVSLGLVELRGLVDKIEVHQIQTVEGRRFPPLRVERGQAEIDESLTDTTGRSSISMSASSRLEHSKLAPTELERATESANVTIATLFSVFTLPNQRSQLKQACSKWRLNVSLPRVDAEGKGRSDDDVIRCYLRALSRRLAPIIEMRLSKLREPLKDMPLQFNDTGSAPRRAPSMSNRLVMSSSVWSVSRPSCAFEDAKSPTGDGLPGAAVASTSVSRFSVSVPTSPKNLVRPMDVELEN